MSEDRLVRARRELEAAAYLEKAEFVNQAASHAYFAAFYAAEATLEELGEKRSKHSGVHAVFGRRVVKTGGVAVPTGRILTRLFDLRIEADYLSDLVEPEVAHQAIADAQRFVDAVQAWLDAR